jgi:hypothetical protein
MLQAINYQLLLTADHTKCAVAEPEMTKRSSPVLNMIQTRENKPKFTMDTQDGGCKDN